MNEYQRQGRVTLVVKCIECVINKVIQIKEAQVIVCCKLHVLGSSTACQSEFLVELQNCS